MVNQLHDSFIFCSFSHIKIGEGWWFLCHDSLFFYCTTNTPEFFECVCVCFINPVIKFSGSTNIYIKHRCIEINKKKIAQKMWSMSCEWHECHGKLREITMKTHAVNANNGENVIAFKCVVTECIECIAMAMTFHSMCVETIFLFIYSFWLIKCMQRHNDLL